MSKNRQAFKEYKARFIEKGFHTEMNLAEGIEHAFFAGCESMAKEAEELREALRQAMAVARSRKFTRDYSPEDQWMDEITKYFNLDKDTP